MKKEIVFIDEATLTPKEKADILGIAPDEVSAFLNDMEDKGDDLNEQQTEKQK